MTKPSKTNVIAFWVCALIVAMISANMSSSVMLGIQTIVGLPVGILVVVANNDLLLILAGLALWGITGISTLLSGHHVWRKVSWSLLAVIVVGTTISVIAGRLVSRGGM